MNNEQFQKILGELALLDAQQFEDAVKVLAAAADEVACDSTDKAWGTAADCLRKATSAIRSRLGN